MKKAKLFTAPCLLAFALFFAVSTYGQVRPQVVATGSSGVYPSMSIAMASPDPVTGGPAYCGTNVWTAGTALASGIDGRSAGIPAEPGNITIVWDGNVDGHTSLTTVCVYFSVDSIVGNRLFFSQALNGGIQTNGSVALAAGALAAPGANKVSFLQDTVIPVGTLSGPGNAACTATAPATTCGLPTNIYNIVNGANFNLAFTDIRPEDALFATNRALCNPIAGDSFKFCLGYGPVSGNYLAIQSTFSKAIANVVPFSIPPGGVPGSTSQGGVNSYNGVSFTQGVDPISGLTIPAATTYPIGADPMMVFVNMTGTGTGSFKNVNPTNINSRVLSQIFSGINGGTAAVTGALNSSASGVGYYAPLTVVEREPMSGTYNTFEFQAVRERDAFYGNSQELNNPYPTSANSNPTCGITQPSSATYIMPAIQCANPLVNSAGFDASNRVRAVGGGEMISAVNSANLPDSIGYAFWSLGSFGNKTNLKYLTVDGIDPLYATPGNGLFPTSTQCTGFFNTSGTPFSCTGYTLPALANVANGDYRIWNIIRGVIDNSVQSYQTTTLTGTANPLGLIKATQDQTSPTVSPRVPDFVPFQICGNASCTTTTQIATVIRSHYGSSGVFPNSGALGPYYAANAITPVPEGGGDVMGAPINIAAILDIVNYYGPDLESQYYNVIQ